MAWRRHFDSTLGVDVLYPAESVEFGSRVFNQGHHQWDGYVYGSHKMGGLGH